MQTTTEHKITITPEKASGPGALDGFGVHCSKCGRLFGSSSEILAGEWAREHVEFMAAKEARAAKLAAIPLWFVLTNAEGLILAVYGSALKGDAHARQVEIQRASPSGAAVWFHEMRKASKPRVGARVPARMMIPEGV